MTATVASEILPAITATVAVSGSETEKKRVGGVQALKRNHTDDSDVERRVAKLLYDINFTLYYYIYRSFTVLVYCTFFRRLVVLLTLSLTLRRVRGTLVSNYCCLYDINFSGTDSVDESKIQSLRVTPSLAAAADDDDDAIRIDLGLLLVQDPVAM